MKWSLPYFQKYKNETQFWKHTRTRIWRNGLLNRLNRCWWHSVADNSRVFIWILVPGADVERCCHQHISSSTSVTNISMIKYQHIIFTSGRMFPADIYVKFLPNMFKSPNRSAIVFLWFLAQFKLAISSVLKCWRNSVSSEIQDCFFYYCRCSTA